jgi:L-serine dehydratase
MSQIEDLKNVLRNKLEEFSHLERFTPEMFLELMPNRYFELMDLDDIEQQYIELYQLKTGIKEVIRRRGDIERFSLHGFNYEFLSEELLKMLPHSSQAVTLFRFFMDRGEDFMLTSCYPDILNSRRRDEFDIPSSKPYENHFLDGHRIINTKPIFIDRSNAKESGFDLIAINISRITLFKNITETFSKQGIAPYFSEVWQLRTPKNRIRSFYLMRIRFRKRFSPEKLQSIMDDLSRYLQSYINPMSIFDMIGPGMVGPSSSHTAGANKIGGIARKMIMGLIHSGVEVKDISVKLFRSFRDTGIGHKTPGAIGGGLAGYEADYAKLMEKGDPDLLKENGIDFEGSNIPFRGFFKGTDLEEESYSSEMSRNIAEILVTTHHGIFIITGCSIGGGNVVIRYINRSPIPFELTDKTEYYVGIGGVYSHNEGDTVLVTPLSACGKNSCEGGPIPFNTFEELGFYIEQQKLSLLEVILKIEEDLQGTPSREIYLKMEQQWEIMSKSIEEGLGESELSLLGLSGGDGKKIHSFRKLSPLFDNLYGEAVAYATAVNEQNAKGRLIVACPTAGSCGILPGVMKAYLNRTNCNKEKVLESIMVAGFLGMILFDDVTTAGADFGCQAEVGAATAMAAGALTYLEGGGTEKIIQAFTLALKNCLGLICDPVAGLVEVPCVKRNGIYTSMAISSSMMALSGVTSFISPDEVVLAMQEVGERLHSDYKETAKGGLAKTRDGKSVEAKMEEESHRFFEDEE